MPGHDLEPLSVHRRLVWDLLRDTDPYYLNHQVFLVDFTTAEAVRARFPEAARPSYVALTLFSLTRVLPSHPVFNSYLRTFPVSRLARYRGIDVAYTIEKPGPDGDPLLCLSILEECQDLAFPDFVSRFEGQKAARLEDLPYYGVFRFFAALPAFVRVGFFRLFCKPFPGIMRKIAGTVGFTSVGRHGVDFTTPLSPKTLTVSLGSVAQRPIVREGRLVAAPSAYVTLTYDHRVADGAACARLGSDLSTFLETTLSQEALACSPA